MNQRQKVDAAAARKALRAGANQELSLADCRDHHPSAIKRLPRKTKICIIALQTWA
jgi:hypothetical protein